MEYSTEFDLSSNIVTKDNYYIQIKGIFEYDSDCNRDKIILNRIGGKLKEYIRSIEMIDTFDLINKEASKLWCELNINDVKNLVIKINTINAIEYKNGNLSIERLLNKIKKSGKLKRLFRRNK